MSYKLKITDDSNRAIHGPWGHRLIKATFPSKPKAVLGNLTAHPISVR